MKRDASGKFVCTWNLETKRRVNVSLTNTAWRSLAKEAQKRGISRSELIEHFARSLEDEPSREPDQARFQPITAQGTECSHNIAERQQAEVEQERLLQALRIERARFEAVLQQMPAGVIIADAVSGKLILANEQAKQIIGYNYEQSLELEDYIPLIPIESFHIDGQAYTADEYPLMRSLRTGEVVTNEEMKVHREDGSHVFVNVNSAPIVDPQGEIIAAVTIFQDVTDRKLIERALRESQTRLRGLLDANLIGIMIGDFQGNIIEANNAWLAALGYTREEVLSGQVNFLEITPPEYQHLDVQAMAEMKRTGCHTPFEKEYIRKDGTRIPVLIGTAYLGGPHDLGIGFLIDLTERKRLESELEQRSQQFRMVVENAPDIISRIDQEFRHLYVSPSVERATGIPPEDFIGKTNADLGMSEELYSVWYNALEQVFTTGQEQTIEFSFPTPEGIRRYQSRIFPEFDKDGSVKTALNIARDVTDYKQVEQALRESEERFRLALVAAQMVSWDMDLQANRVVCSPNAIDIWGLQEGAGEEFFALIHPEDRQQVIQAAEQAIAGNPIYAQEYRMQGVDGVMRWINSQGRVYLDETGRGVRTMGVSVDITERKQIEAERDRQDRQQQFLIELNNSIRAIQDPKEVMWQVVCATGQYFNVTRCTYGEVDPAQEYLIVDRDFCNGVSSVVGRHHMDSFGPEIIAELKRGKTVVVDDVDTDPRTAGVGVAAFEAIQTKSLLCVPLVKVGRFVALFVLHHFSPRTWTEEEVALMEQIAEQTWLAVERSRAEEELRESEARLRLALQVGRVGTWDWDLQTGALQWSEGHFTVFGLQPNECEPSYKTWASRVHPDDLAEVEARLQQAIAHKKDYYHEYRLRWSDGSIHWVEARGQFTYDAQQAPKYSIGAVVDITERKQVEQEREQLLERERIARSQAEAANRIKDEFLAVLSHELRSPLNPILGWTKILRSGRLDATKAEQALDTIERNAKLQAQLIEDLLDVSRILQGKMTLNVAPVNLVPTIEAALETVRLAAEAKGIQIQKVFNPSVGQILGDSARLQQVIWNLLSNAMKFTPSAGIVEIHLDQVGTYAQIQVKDTGKGINPQFLPYVFEYFRQEDGTTTRKFGGLGLGLAIVRHLVELHGGTVSAESPGESRGATFSVRLPLLIKPETPESGTEEAELSSQPSAPTTPLAGLHILVVDDEPDMRDIVAFVLEQSGAVVSVAVSASEALNLITQPLPDVLLCDIGMPDMDGYMLMRQIRTRPPEQGGQILAIALTAYAGEVNQQQAIAAGFQRHLAKPIEPDELIAAIKTLAETFAH